MPYVGFPAVQSCGENVANNTDARQFAMPLSLLRYSTRERRDPIRSPLKMQSTVRGKIGTTKDTKSTKMEFDDLSNRVIGCAIEVHRHLGPGLLESAYEQCLAHELSRNNIAFQLQLAQPVRYKDVLLDCGYRIDVLVEDRLIIELKSAEKLLGIHEAQLLT